MQDIQEFPLLNSIDDFVSDWARVLMKSLNINPQELYPLYSELHEHSKIDPSLIATTSDARTYLNLDETNWEYWVKRIASAAILNSEVVARGPFRIDIGTTIFTEKNLFGIQGLDHEIIFYGAIALKEFFKAIDTAIGLEKSPEERAKDYELVEKGSKGLDMMVTASFGNTLMEIQRTYDLDFQTPSIIYPEKNYLENMRKEGLDPNAIRIYEVFFFTCRINRIVSTTHGGANRLYLRYNHKTGEVLTEDSKNRVVLDESDVIVYHQNGYFWLAPKDNPEFSWLETEEIDVKRPSGVSQPFFQMPGDSLLESYLCELNRYFDKIK